MADVGSADVAILGELERIDTQSGSAFRRWMSETFGVAENSLGFRPLRDDYIEGAFVVRFPELPKARAIRDGFAAQCEQEGWYTPTPGDAKGKFGAAHPPKLLFAKGPTALHIVAKKIAPEYVKDVQGASDGELRQVKEQLASVAVGSAKR